MCFVFFNSFRTDYDYHHYHYYAYPSIFQVIAAEGEQKASRALREAAEVIAESPSALQVISTVKVKVVVN